MKKVYWNDIPGYEEMYQASNYGDIKSFKFGKEVIMKQNLRKDGYYQIGLTKNKKQKLFLVHQLVAQAFLGHVIDGHITVIDHEDNDGTNNYIGNPEGNYEDGNLHVVPHRDNCSICARKDRDTMSSKLPGASWSKSHNKWESRYHYQGKKYHLGFYNKDNEAHNKWKEAYEADKNGIFEQFILTIENKQIKSVNQYTKSGEFIREWKSATEASKELGINNSSISSCCNNKRKSAGGYVWEYKE